MRPKTGFDFWRFCFRLGPRESVRGIDYFRYYEFPTVLELADLRAGDSVLDLGCGKSLFPLAVASWFPEVRYTTVDIDEEAVAWQRRAGERLGGLPNLTVKVGDSTRLEFPDDSFDRAINLGSIEHIPEEGDRATAAEMGRVVRPGGASILSVPYSFQGVENPTTDHWHGFERRYDDETVQDRLIEPSGCGLESNRYFGEPRLHFSDWWYSLPFPLRLPFRHMAPLASRVWLKEIPISDRSGACGIQIVLRKSL